MATAHLEWTPGGGIAQEVRYKRASDSTYILFDTVDGLVNSIDIPDLDDNVLYKFRIINKCEFGFETPSSEQLGAFVTCPMLTLEMLALQGAVEFTPLGGDVDVYTVQIFEMPGETLVSQVDLAHSPGSVAYSLDGLTPDTYYKFKVIPKIGSFFLNDSCEATERTLGCEPDYTLAPDGSYCYKIEEVAATPPSGGTAENTVAVSHDSYGTYGTYIYNFGFNVNGTGTSSLIPVGNTFWINGDGSGVNNPARLGPLNRCGLWTSSQLSNQDIGFSVCIDIPETKTYYIGVGGDNNCRIVLDGVVRVDQNAAALGTQYSIDAQAAFKIWHVYPIALSAGPHIIELIGHNVSGAASLGAEIYNNTAQELIDAVSYSDLTLVFSTMNYIGQPVQLGSNNLGFTCPSGYALAACEVPFVCRRILTALPS